MYERWKKCFGTSDDDKLSFIIFLKNFLVFPIIDLSNDNRRNDFNAWVRGRT